MKIKYSFLAQSAAIAMTTLFRVPDGVARDYTVSVYAVDRGGTLAATGGPALFWTDDVSTQLIQPAPVGVVTAIHANPATDVALRCLVGAGVSDFDVIVCVEEIK